MNPSISLRRLAQLVQTFEGGRLQPHSAVHGQVQQVAHPLALLLTVVQRVEGPLRGLEGHRHGVYAENDLSLDERDFSLQFFRWRTTFSMVESWKAS